MVYLFGYVMYVMLYGENLMNKWSTLILMAFVATMLFVLYGYSISILWEYFIEPLTGKHISWLHGMGIALFVSLFIPYNPNGNQNKNDSVMVTSIIYLLKPVIVIIMGWIIFKFMWV